LYIAGTKKDGYIHACLEMLMGMAGIKKFLGQ
jgi:hypothetical protein